ncbi:hypothetical protein AVEN_136565-1 [Araneus ventricosus]|uniref:Uncharacterized protein n=1 Tax=Araneus ventricosus TaxID=182803 RepID=A0A4Y2GS53_ARAVE|nr:hypothetical protein AVEN_136565-1 [Araneus ventricosus]
MCALLGQQALLPSTIYHANEAARTSPKSPFPDVSLRHRACLLQSTISFARHPPYPLLIRRWVARSSITHEEEVRESEESGIAVEADDFCCCCRCFFQRKRGKCDLPSASIHSKLSTSDRNRTGISFILLIKKVGSPEECETSTDLSKIVLVFQMAPPSPNFHTTPSVGRSTHYVRFIAHHAHKHGRSLVELGIKPGTIRLRSRDLITRPPRSGNA